MGVPAMRKRDGSRLLASIIPNEFVRCRPARLCFMRSARVAVVLDVCCVLVFVIIGRANHAKGESLGGIASTSWPFLCGLAAGWVASRAWRRPLALLPAGLAVWLCTVALGMVLRVVSGQGTAVGFIVVALAFLGLCLLGWRVIGHLLTR
jgi:DUF3054 family protein